MNKVKILFVVPDFYPNSTGFANATKNMVDSLVKFGSDKYEIFVYTNVQLYNNKEIEKVTVFRQTKRYFLENRFTYEICDRLRYNKLKDIILFNNPLAELIH